MCLHFCNLRTPHPERNLTITETQIPVLNEYTFLGVIFDEKLSFIPDIKYLKAKYQNALNLLKVSSHMDRGTDRKALLRLYRDLTRFKLDYGCIVYGWARSSYINSLDTIQNQGLRLYFGTFRTSLMERLFVKANEPSLYNRRGKLPRQSVLKLKSNPQNPTYQDRFHPKLTTTFENKPKAIPTFGINIQHLLNDINVNIKQVATNIIPGYSHYPIRSPFIQKKRHEPRYVNCNICRN